ncbi:hypothetical protein SISNIDRAFT_456171, partial [Sistotremastrum niveocremeum HHB9708]
MASALALKVPSSSSQGQGLGITSSRSTPEGSRASSPTITKSTSATSNATATSSTSAGTSKLTLNTTGKVEDISSPHELTAFVETLLGQLEGKFDEMSSSVLARMDQMSTRVDALEASIQDIINGDFESNVSVPQSPTASSVFGGGSGKSGSGGMLGVNGR